MPDDPTINSQDTPSPEAEQSSEEKKVTQRTFTEEEHFKAISDERAKTGRLKSQLETVTKERDVFKSQVGEATKAAEEAKTALEETNKEIASLEEDYRLAIADNADAAEINKIKKDLKAANTALVARQKALDSERETWAGTVAEAQAIQFEADVFEVAEGYKDGDSEQLKRICKKADKKKRDEMEEMADILWERIPSKENNEKSSLRLDSGATAGGGKDWSKVHGSDMVAQGLLEDKKRGPKHHK